MMWDGKKSLSQRMFREVCASSVILVKQVLLQSSAHPVPLSEMLSTMETCHVINGSFVPLPLR